MDRRVTDQNTSIYNNNANKGICLRLRDGVFTVAFTGIAHVNGIPSDDWLAGVILGKEWSRQTDFSELASFSFGKSGCPEYLHDVLQRLHKALSRQSEIRPFFRRYPLEISVSGLRAKRGHLLPYLLVIRKPRGSKTISYELSERAGSRDLHFFKIYISGGWGERHNDIMMMLKTSISSIKDPTSTESINEIIGHLHYAVRLFSLREPSIGPDVMRIAHLPHVNYSKVEFAPHDPRLFSSPFLYGAEVGAPIHYNPWIISPGTRFSPQGVIGGGQVVWADGHEFELASTTPLTSGTTALGLLPLVRK